MALVAVALFRGERCRGLPRLALVLPSPESASHRHHVRVAELTERLRRERRPHTTGAVDDDRRVVAGDAGLDLRFEMASRDVDDVDEGALLVLVGLTHVEHNGAGRGDA